MKLKEISVGNYSKFQVVIILEFKGHDFVVKKIINAGVYASLQTQKSFRSLLLSTQKVRPETRLRSQARVTHA